MERRCALAAFAILVAAAAGSAGRAQDGADEALCSGVVALSSEQAAACRAAFWRRVEAERVRIAQEREARRQGALALRKARRAGAAPLATFLGDNLAHGDIVVTDKGAMVYLGESGAAAQPGDFAPLGSARSPARTRARAGEIDRAAAAGKGAAALDK